ncbi:pyruvate, phosphate dikinase [Amycolatopsis sp. K13G38]|uniref:Pyruvate, phosphate dikinase n=1 Tax=Amycolatopsis acididurans TaxID=2724524 RepID=A0ABX1J1L9_9PSEU|nr:pyruvate, phosphate dikinase [Amycolatopsis acididurans]NKQ52250.1 pyruvate, phosphate dikinase [Amycolatopsis acididurans]
MNGGNDSVAGSLFTLTFDEADPEAVDQLGGKGAGLARMTRQGLRVPPGFIVSTEACRQYLKSETMPAGLLEEISDRLAGLETRTAKTFGRGPRPLLLSVRSGAPISMPGMMDTVLNLGLSRESAVALATAAGDTRFMADLVARFHSMYGEIVLGALGDEQPPDEVLSVRQDDDPGAAFDRVWSACAHRLLADTGEEVPEDPREQLAGAVRAVFGSWNTSRARTYREFHKIPHDLGTAVVVQSMVFGNISDDSGSGVVFTRDPATGEPGLFGEYLAHSQGEDVVAGTRTPDPVREALPAPVLAELEQTATALEANIGDVLDIEFTVEHSTLYLLQVRGAKRTPDAAVRIASDFLTEGVVPPRKVLAHVAVEHVRQVQRPGFDEAEVEQARAGGRLLTTGIGACPGQVSGELVLDSDRAKQLAEAGHDVVLARPVTSPADLHGMIAAQGIVTATGGSTSHAAVVARALGKVCVVGASALKVDLAARTVVAGGQTLREGDHVSVDGSSGEVFTGSFATSAPTETGSALESLMSAASDLTADCAIFGKVTLPADVPRALSAGATGLVTALDDVLAASGHLDRLVQALMDSRDAGAPHLEPVADAIAAEVAPLLREAGEVEFGVRAIDFISDESRELMQQTALTTRYPSLAVPLGIPELIEAQIAGLRRAMKDAGGTASVHLAVRHISDPAEAAALHGLRPPAGSGLTVGAYLTSPRALANFRGIADASNRIWLEMRVLQAAMFGIPARQLLTAEPLDSYVKRGLLTTDPRSTVDPSLEDALGRCMTQAGDSPIGIRLSGAVSEELVAGLHGKGFRRFAVDADETRPLVLALAKAGLA